MQVIPELIGGFVLVFAVIVFFILAVRADGSLGWNTFGSRVYNPDQTEDDDSTVLELDKADPMQKGQSGSGVSKTMSIASTLIPSSETQLSENVSNQNSNIESAGHKSLSNESVSNESGSIKSLSNESGSIKSVSNESGSIKSVSNESGSIKSLSNESGSIKSLGNESGGNKSVSIDSVSNGSVSKESYSNYHTRSETSYHKIISNMADLQKVYPDVQPLLRDVQTFAPIIGKLLELSDGVNTKINDYNSLGSDIANFLVSVKSQFNNVTTGGKVDFAALNSTLDRLKRQVDEMMPE